MTRWHMGLAAWIAMTLAFVVFWALIVTVIIAVVRSDRPHDTPAPPAGRGERGGEHPRRTLRPRRDRRRGVPAPPRPVAGEVTT